MMHLSLVPSVPNEEVPTFETLDFYRPWCRYCGTREGPCVIADDQDWVQDEDDLGFPICLDCTRRFSPARAVVWLVTILDTYQYQGRAETLAVCADRNTARLVAEAFLDDNRCDFDDIGTWDTQEDREYLTVGFEEFAIEPEEVWS